MNYVLLLWDFLSVSKWSIAVSSYNCRFAFLLLSVLSGFASYVLRLCCLNHAHYVLLVHWATLTDITTPAFFLNLFCMLYLLQFFILSCLYNYIWSEFPGGNMLLYRGLFFNPLWKSQFFKICIPSPYIYIFI